MPADPIYPEPVARLIAELSSLPSIGRRSAERLAFHIVKSSDEKALALAAALRDVKRAVHPCSICFNLASADPCAVCESPRRDAGQILVVEQPKDLIAIEQTGMFSGVYHVLMGRLAPLDGVGPGELTIDRLLRRLDDPTTNARSVTVQEVILGLSPTLEGDATALYLREKLAEASRSHVDVSRLARGLQAGVGLERANKAVLGDALLGRQRL